ncbi:MAG: hypothetical protein ACE5IR_11585 [bacterium]
MTDEDILQIIDPIIECLKKLNIPYQIGGSIASSAYGFPRTTVDADLGAEITDHDIPSLVKRLKKDYYIEESAIREAIKHKRSFNIIHLETTFKIDIFILKQRRFDREAISRRRKGHLDEEGKFDFYLSSPEDTILYKLEWYKIGGCVSDRQWKDIIGILKVQKHNLDKNYLLKWAKELEVLDLLKKAFEDSGFEEDD